MELNGTYKGFSPTDESGVAVGELEVVIADEHLSFRFATGLEIQSGQVPRTELRELTITEVASRFNPGADIEGITGYVLGEEGPIFLFLREAPEAPESPRVLLLRFVSDEIDAVFGPTQLFMPEQVQAGLFDQAVTEIESYQGDSGVIPRLSNNGRRL